MHVSLRAAQTFIEGMIGIKFAIDEISFAPNFDATL